MSGTLFDSKIIKNEIREKYKMIVELYQQEVTIVEEIFASVLKEFKKMGFKVRSGHNFSKQQNRVSICNKRASHARSFYDST